MKKLLLSLGAVAAVVAPVASVVACGSNDSDDALSKLKTQYKDQINKYAEDSAKEGLLAKVDALKTKEEAVAFAQTPEMVKVMTAAAAAALTPGAGAGTPAAGTGTGTPIAGTGTGTVVSTTATDAEAVTAPIADVLTGTSLTVNVEADDTDYQPQLAAKVATIVYGTTEAVYKDVTDITIVVTEETGGKAAKSTVTLGSSANVQVRINEAINAATTKIADSSLLSRKMSMTEAGYLQALTALVKTPGSGFAGANKILEAIGNGSRFTDVDTLKLVSGKSNTFPTDLGKIKAHMTFLVTSKVLGTFDSNIETELNAAIAALS